MDVIIAKKKLLGLQWLIRNKPDDTVHAMCNCYTVYTVCTMSFCLFIHEAKKIRSIPKQMIDLQVRG